MENEGGQGMLPEGENHIIPPEGGLSDFLETTLVNFWVF